MPSVKVDEATSTDSFIRFAGFKNNSSVGAALRPFLKGNNAILEKRGSRVRYRERTRRNNYREFAFNANLNMRTPPALVKLRP
jgi:hypothetical protein